MREKNRKKKTLSLSYFLVCCIFETAHKYNTQRSPSTKRRERKKKETETRKKENEKKTLVRTCVNTSLMSFIEHDHRVLSQ